MRTWLCTENPPRQGALSSLPVPAEHAAAQFLGQRVLAREKREHRAPKALKVQRLGHRRHGDKRSIGQENGSHTYSLLVPYPRRATSSSTKRLNFRSGDIGQWQQFGMKAAPGEDSK